MKKKKLEEDAIRSELKGYTPIVVTFQQGFAWFGSERMESTEIGSMAAECKLLKEMRIWKLFQEKIRYDAIENMMLANSVPQMDIAKDFLKVLNSLNTMVENFINYEKTLPRIPNVSKKPS